MSVSRGKGLFVEEGGGAFGTILRPAADGTGPAGARRTAEELSDRPESGDSAGTRGRTEGSTGSPTPDSNGVAEVGVGCTGAGAAGSTGCTAGGGAAADAAAPGEIAAGARSLTTLIPTAAAERGRRTKAATPEAPEAAGGRLAPRGGA